MTDAEASLLAARARPGTEQLVGLIVAPLVLACLGWLVGAGLAWWMQRLGVHVDGAARIGLWSFLGLGLVVDALILRLVLGARSRERADLWAREVELITVTAGKVLDVGTDTHPGLLFDCGDRTLLYLGGRFLLDTVRSDAADAAPHARSRFPSSRLTVVRAPRSGAVLRLEAEGDPLEPPDRLRPPGMRLPMLEWREAEVIAGTLDGSPAEPSRDRRPLEAAHSDRP